MSAGVHGMAARLVAPDWPRLTPAELAPILARYPGLGPCASIAWHSPRPFAASAILQCAGGEVFAKRHNTRVRTVANLAEEHGFIAHLRAQGASVPAVLRAADGATAIAGPGGTYELHALAQGTDRYRDAHAWTVLRSPSDACAIGHALGRLHLASAGYDAPPRRTRLLVAADETLHAADPIAAIAERACAWPLLGAALAGRDWRAGLTRAVVGWQRALLPHLAALPPLWVHADLHASNALWQHGEVSAVIDFGLCNRASAVFDLATTLERNTIAWLDLSASHTNIARPDLMAALLEGYDAARPRPAAERRALPAMLPLVHVDFALSELAYFHGVTNSTENADAAYQDFLIGHLLWFATQDGRHSLLAAEQAGSA